MIGFRAVGGAVLAGSLLAAIWIGTMQFRDSDPSMIPLAPVRSGEFVAVIRTRGQIQAQRSFPIYTPLIADLRIAWMAPPSALIQEGDPMVRFDSSSAERDLIQRRSGLERARASLDRALADADAAAEHDRRDLLDARLGVEIAELGTTGDAFVARLDAERARIDLRVAVQQLRQLEAEIAERQVSREAQIASLRRQLQEAEAWVQLIESRIARMEIMAPLSGYAIYSPNRSTLSGALAGGAEQPYRVGDQVSGGLILATIPELSSLLIDVTVEEVDRGRLHVGDEVIIRVDALPEVTIETTLTEISPLAELSIDARGRSFHAYAALGPGVDERIRPGMNGSMDIVTARIPDAMIVPSQAVFTRMGRPAVHLAESGGFRTVDVDVLARNPDEVAISGIAAGARVALIDPYTGAGAATASTGAAREGTR